MGIKRADNAQTRWRTLVRNLGWASYAEGGETAAAPKIKAVRTPAAKKAPANRSGSGFLPSSPSVKVMETGSPVRGANGIKKEGSSPRKKSMSKRGKMALEAEVVEKDEEEVGADENEGEQEYGYGGFSHRSREDEKAFHESYGAGSDEDEFNDCIEGDV